MSGFRVTALIGVTCLVTSVSASAAVVSFSGTVNSPVNTQFANGTAVVMQLNYTPAVGLQAVINTATLAIGGDSWTTLTGASNFISIIENGMGNDDLSIQMSFGPSTNGLGSLASVFNMTINGGVDLGVAPDASEVNIGLLAANGNSATGSLFLFPELTTVNFSGTAVPEPSSVLAMGAMGLCLVGGVWRKRKQSQLTA